MADSVRGSDLRRKFVGILFADIEKYSKLREPQLKVFMAEIVPEIARIIERHNDGIVELNTWGDGLYIASEQVLGLAHLALDYRDYFIKTDWTRFQLPEELTVRVALHYAPVFSGFDPVRKKDGIVGGVQVSKAARIEPITPSGHIWVTDVFRSVVMQEGDSKLEFDDLGDRKLAKDYGTAHLYNLRWKSQEPYKEEPVISLIAVPEMMPSQGRSVAGVLASSAPLPQLPALSSVSTEGALENSIDVQIPEAGVFVAVDARGQPPRCSITLRLRNSSQDEAMVEELQVIFAIGDLVVRVAEAKSQLLTPGTGFQTVACCGVLERSQLDSLTSMPKHSSGQLMVVVRAVAHGHHFQSRATVYDVADSRVSIER